MYAETGDATLMSPLQQIWTDLVSHKLYITGGCGALYDGASPDGEPAFATVSGSSASAAVVAGAAALLAQVSLWAVLLGNW